MSGDLQFASVVRLVLYKYISSVVAGCIVESDYTGGFPSL
jgi:hypothetical protein